MVAANNTTSGWVFNWKRSATHKYGILQAFGQSTGTAADLQLVGVKLTASTSAFFCAVGI
jgi:hypothetical protein